MPCRRHRRLALLAEEVGRQQRAGVKLGATHKLPRHWRQRWSDVVGVARVVVGKSTVRVWTEHAHLLRRRIPHALVAEDQLHAVKVLEVSFGPRTIERARANHRVEHALDGSVLAELAVRSLDAHGGHLEEVAAGQDAHIREE